jgi:DNA helicase-2/ATP-dependent DNA helicase PcrA
MKMVYQLKLFADSNDAYKATLQIANTSGVLKDLEADKSVEGQGRLENAQELLNGVKQFVETRQKDGNTATLAEYLEEVSLMTGDEKNEDDSNKVSLMTIHASKGLEFKNVFLCGVEEGLFPSQKSAESSVQLEEERRLFYVAVTRAQKRLVISFARMRFKYGQLAPAQPSRFIKEIDTKYLDFGAGGESQFEAARDIPYAGRFRKTFAENDRNIAARPVPKFGNFKKYVPGSGPNRAAQVSPSDLKEGTEIKHSRFGRGRIVAFEKMKDDTKLTIDFINVGRKVLMQKYAIADMQIVN